MELMGQGLVLMIAGMGIVYAFLYVLIFVSDWSSRFVSRFEAILPDDKPKKMTRAAMPETPKEGTVSLKVALMDKVATGDTVAFVS